MERRLWPPTVGLSSLVRASSRVCRVTSVVCVAVRHAQLDEREPRDEDEQNHRLGGCGSEIIELECVTIQLVDHEISRVGRATLRHQIDQRETAEKRVDSVDHDQKHQRGRHQWDVHVDQPAPRLDAVEFTRLVERLRDVVERGQHEDHVVAHLLPDGSHCHHPEPLPADGEPVEGEPEPRLR